MRNVVYFLGKHGSIKSSVSRVDPPSPITAPKRLRFPVGDLSGNSPRCHSRSPGLQGGLGYLQGSLAALCRSSWLV